MILLDTRALVFDALTPERLSGAAREALDRGEAEGTLACADISLWEVAMLVRKGRLDPGTDSASFCRLALDAGGYGCCRSRPRSRWRRPRSTCPRVTPRIG